VPLAGGAGAAAAAVSLRVAGAPGQIPGISAGPRCVRGQRFGHSTWESNYL